MAISTMKDTHKLMLVFHCLAIGLLASNSPRGRAYDSETSRSEIHTAGSESRIGQTYEEEGVAFTVRMASEMPPCSSAYAERRQKLGLRYSDHLPEELKLTKLPKEWRKMAPWEIEAERRKILGIKTRDRIPAEFTQLPSKVVYLAGQMMAENHNLSIEDAIYLARTLYEYRKQDKNSSRDESSSRKDKDKGYKGENKQAKVVPKQKDSRALLLEQAISQLRNLTAYPAWYYAAKSSASKDEKGKPTDEM